MAASPAVQSPEGFASNCTRCEHLALGLWPVPDEFYEQKFFMSYDRIDHFHCDPDNWKLGIFYFCRADQRMIVPKRIRGLGWTLNFARPLAVPFVCFIVALAYGVLELTRALGAGDDARFAIKLLLALGLIALCYRLSKPWTKSLGEESDSGGREI